MQSMTGFGRCNLTKETREYRVDIKTVNHKYNDVNIKISKAYSWLEPKIRRYITNKLFRGKIDVNIIINNIGNTDRVMILDEELVHLYINSYNKIKQKYNINSEIDLSVISRIPDIFKLELNEDEEGIWLDLEEVLNISLDNLINMRQNEGKSLKEDILSRIDVLNKIILNIKDKAPLVVEDYRKKLHSRINEIIDDKNIDEIRLEMEVALFADKCNIDEEITRLQSHINQFNDTINSYNSIGKKLDFIIQEINREINTVGAKANNVDITKDVIEFKAELEKIREQVQNVE